MPKCYKIEAQTDKISELDSDVNQCSHFLAFLFEPPLRFVNLSYKFLELLPKLEMLTIFRKICTSVVMTM